MLKVVSVLLMLVFGGYSSAVMAADSPSLFQELGQALGMAVLLTVTIYLFKNYIMKK